MASRQSKAEERGRSFFRTLIGGNDSVQDKKTLVLGLLGLLIVMLAVILMISSAVANQGA